VIALGKLRFCISSSGGAPGIFLVDAGHGFRFSMKPMQYRAATPEAMEALGRATAATVRHGSVIALCGGLGTGKTHWTKGLVAALGSPAEVTSPTFALVHEYPGGKMPVFHLDFYRLENPQELIALGWDEYLEGDGVVIAEWGDKFPELFPLDTTWLIFSIAADGSRTVRESVT
jgi:tRNA threonylcarbamoyladenosine biosynthesis protein TsaE